jgi:putative hydrolases of HD superfamily
MKGIVTFLYEVGQLKLLKRMGWFRIGIKDPESILEHSARTALVAYLLARKQNITDPAILLKVVLGGLLHDLPETRIGDLDYMAQKYIDKKEIESKVLKDQLSQLETEGESPLSIALLELDKPTNSESVLIREIVKDADKIECAIQAREYELQNSLTEPWIESALSGVTTEAGREMLQYLLQIKPTDWIRR